MTGAGLRMSEMAGSGRIWVAAKLQATDYATDGDDEHGHQRTTEEQVA